VGAHSAAASGATHIEFPSAPAAVAVHASSGAGAGAEGALSLARAPLPALAKARSGDNLDAWQARCRASSGAAGASSDYGNAPVQDLTARPLRRSEWFQAMQDCFPHSPCGPCAWVVTHPSPPAGVLLP